MNNKTIVQRIEKVVDEIDSIIGDIHKEIAPRVQELKGAPSEDLYVRENQLYQLTEANGSLRAFLEIDGISVEQYLELLKEGDVDPKEFNEQARLNVMEYHFLKDPKLEAKILLNGLLSILK